MGHTTFNAAARKGGAEISRGGWSGDLSALAKGHLRRIADRFGSLGWGGRFCIGADSRHLISASLMSASLKIAFIGTGVMGRSMAGHLQKAGHALHVHNRTKAKAAALLEAGAIWHDSAGSAAAQADRS